MVVPSFSSRGFSGIKKIIHVCSEYISAEILLSAYDIIHHSINPSKMTFQSLTFIDSGGYEISDDTDFSEIRGATKKQKTEAWNPDLHRSALKSLDYDRPIVLVNYDNPDLRQNLETQIKRAQNLFREFPNAKSEILLKAEPHRDYEHKKSYLNVDKVIALLGDLSDFDILAATEKELGASIFERMVNIAKIRKALSDRDRDTPLHIFGSLDPISTPLYFFAGADIFDGLTWLRYGYLDDLAIYQHNFGAQELGIPTKIAQMHALIHSRNYTYLQNMQIKMKQFLLNDDFGVFGKHAKLFENSAESLREELGE